MVLPSEIELAREYGVSVGTMRRSLDLLEAHRLVERRQGHGTFVLDHANKRLANRFDKIIGGDDDPIFFDHTLLFQEGGTSTSIERKRLGLQNGEQVLRTRRVCSHRDRPFAYEEACIAVGRLPGFSSDAKIGDYQIAPFVQRHGALLAHAVETITVVEANPEVAGLLNVNAKTPLLRCDRIVYSTEGLPIEWRVAFCNLREGYYVAEMQ